MPISLLKYTVGKTGILTFGEQHLEMKSRAFGTSCQIDVQGLIQDCEK